MQVGELWVKISGKTEAFNAAMAKVEESVKAAASRVEASSQAVLKAVGIAATAASVAIGAIGVKSIESAANAQAMNAQFEQVFGAIQSSAQNAVNELGADFGMLPNRLKPALTSMTSMFKGLGYDTQEAMKMAEQGVTIAADAAAFYDKSYEEANAALNSFIKGNYEGGEAIGLFGNETQIASYAAENLGINWNSASEAQKQLARLEYAEAMQKAAGATGQAARESESYQNQLGNLKQGWIDFTAILGQPLLEPVISALKGMTEHLTTFKDLVTAEGLAGALEKIFPDWLEGTIVVIAGAITAAMIPALKGLGIEAAKAMIPLLPYIAAGAAIAGLAYLIIKNWEPIKGFFIDLWEEVKTKTIEIWDGIKQFLVDWWPLLLSLLTGPIGLVVGLVVQNWDDIKLKTTEIWTTISTWLYGLWNTIKNQVAASWNAIYTTITSIWTRIKDGFNNLVQSAKNWGKNLMNEFIDGIKSMFGRLDDVLESAADRVSGFLGFHSPTKLGPGRDADKWAPNFVKMFADGIIKSLPTLENAVNQMASISPAMLGPSITNNSSSSSSSPTLLMQPGAIQINSNNPRDVEDTIMRVLHKAGIRQPR